MANPSRNGGVALIITLAMIAILTFLIVAFFSRAVSNVQIESASTGSARADVLARSAGEVIIGDMKAEIIAGSSTPSPTPPSSLPRTYTPSVRANAVPAVVRSSAVAGDPTTFANLVKQSTDRFFPNNANYSNVTPIITPIIQTVTTVATDVASPNGRTVINKRWDNPDPNVPLGPQLLISANTPTASRFSSSSMLPHWVMVTRQGVPAAQGTWVAAWKDYSLGNQSAAIGRFAYNIYDVGGLLDVNAAGYPESGSAAPTAQMAGRKGNLGLATLSTIPGINTADNATKFASAWRNLSSSTTADNYLAYLGFPKNGTTDLTANAFFMTGPRSGFLTPAVGTSSADNRVLGRQDLIRLAVKTNAGTPSYGLSELSLPYLTHFTREVNAPTWSPTTPTGSALGVYDYANNKDNRFYANRAFLGVRVKPFTGTAWTRITGEQVVAGEPLIKYRFPLSWLALLQDNDPTNTSWDLTPEARTIIKAINDRRAANGAGAIPGGSPEAQASWLVSRLFGLTWNPNPTDSKGPRWEYTGSNGSTTVQTAIELLGNEVGPTNSVVQEAREPNFFELLKAGILKGSLGSASDYESFCVNATADLNPDYQIIQIGANIIDQADSDSYPTMIAFGVEYDAPSNLLTTITNQPGPALPGVKVFAGVEDVPYIQSILGTLYRRPATQPNLGNSPGDAAQTPARDYINGWVQFVLWKPQQQSIFNSGPTEFRIRYTGSGSFMLIAGPGGSVADPYVVFNGVTFANTQTAPVLPSGTTVSFTDAPTSFRVPTLLGGMGQLPADGFVASQNNGGGGNGGDTQMPRGMWVGEAYRPEKIYTPSDSPNRTAPPTKWTEFRNPPDSTFELQYKDGTGTWRTYQHYDRFGMGSVPSFNGRGYGWADSPIDPAMQATGNPVLPVNGYPAYRALDIANFAVSAADPRSHRYGLIANSLDPAAIASAPPSDWKYFLKQGWAPTSGASANYGIFNPSGVRFNPSWSGGTLPNPWSNRTANAPITDPTKFWADNSATATGTGYNDVDSATTGTTLRRRADGDSPDNVRPMQLNGSGAGATANSGDLGLVLNRPFRSVGELGYAFRDEPYKSLNLFTANSADSALLDIFSVTDQPALVAGKVNLNTKNPNALQAVIVGTNRQELAASPNTISASDALAIATKLVSNTSDLSNAANTGPLLNLSEIANRLETIMPTSNTPDQAIKTRREVVGRALAGSGQTRTWNFLVDIIAQSGRYGSNASKTEDFIVDGEKRYWLHVAIDRYTGQVVDKQLEPVME